MGLLRLWWCYLVALYWRRRHIHAKEFRLGVEDTIIRERYRAQRDVEVTEVLARRAEFAVVAARADRGIEARRTV